MRKLKVDKLLNDQWVVDELLLLGNIFDWNKYDQYKPDKTTTYAYKKLNKTTLEDFQRRSVVEINFKV